MCGWKNHLKKKESGHQVKDVGWIRRNWPRPVSLSFVHGEEGHFWRKIRVPPSRIRIIEGSRTSNHPSLTFAVLCFCRSRFEPGSLPGAWISQSSERRWSPYNRKNVLLEVEGIACIDGSRHRIKVTSSKVSRPRTRCSIQ
jgi:hypothetical protein